ncbi:hypothetical protein K438DRAFT_1900906 [Mycena galopus ATCC 62051]|nr:hypothetical protein K438DRAFT_1900906 [Mycena galopus ATCC 62051]
MSGLIPCTPWKPYVTVTVRVLEMYRIAHARCPQFAIQSFMKTLRDLYETPYLPYLRKQFSICYDLYLDLRRNAEKMVLTSLGRDSFAWRLKHACLSCMYKLEGEEKLIFDILVTMDGNNSLKQVLHQEKVQSDGDTGTDTMFVVGKSKGHADSKDAGDGYYLDREKREEPNPCADQWKNMVEDVTAKMWGIFDETGIFLCLCRHGFVLVICDMIKSGELSKYPLAVTDCLIENLGQNIGNGCDVGCDFQTMIWKSPLAARARQCNFRHLVGAFHGHAHNRLFLGLGCEDLEGCEQFFSGWFHRQQEITAYVKHHDNLHTYTNLSKFIGGNYKQALETLKKEDTLLWWMDEEEVTSFDTFRIWLEEKEFLLGLKAGSKDQTQTLEMEYVQKLVNLDASQSLMTTVAEIKQKKYQKALDAVELLVVERIFELTKMNQSQTGNLTWEQVVEYTFLVDFDILRDTRVEVQSRPWTQPAYHLAMDMHIKKD